MPGCRSKEPSVLAAPLPVAAFIRGTEPMLTDVCSQHPPHGGLHFSSVKSVPLTPSPYTVVSAEQLWIHRAEKLIHNLMVWK